MQRLTLRAGLPPIRLHDLRHTHASIGLVAGVAPKSMQDRLGHAAVGTTMDIYTKVLPVKAAEVAELVGGVMAERRRERGLG